MGMLQTLIRFTVGAAKPMRSKWIFVGAVVLMALAVGGSPSALAERLNQTVPPITPLPPPTPVPTATPTFTPPPAPPPPTATPTSTSASPSATPVEGTTAEPTATPTETATPEPSEEPTVTAVPQFALSLTQSMQPTSAWQGQEIELQFTVTNPSQAEAVNVVLRNALPASLVFVSAEANHDGELDLETDPDGSAVVVLRWPTLAPGGQLQSTIVVEIAPETPNGTVIDNLAVAYADNASGSTAGIGIGMPPAVLPVFN